MSFKIATWFPFNTLPEAREYFRQHSVLDNDKAATAQHGTVVAMYESSVGAWVAFKYMQAGVAITAGQVVSHGAKHKAQIVVAASTINGGRAFGYAPAAITASYWGWIQIGGPNVYKVLTDKTVIAGGKAIKKLTATAGLLTKPASTGSQDGFVLGRALQSDSGSYMAPGKFMFPMVK